MNKKRLLLLFFDRKNTPNSYRLRCWDPKFTPLKSNNSDSDSNMIWEAAVLHCWCSSNQQFHIRKNPVWFMKYQRGETGKSHSWLLSQHLESWRSFAKCLTDCQCSKNILTVLETKKYYPETVFCFPSQFSMFTIHRVRLPRWWSNNMDMDKNLLWIQDTLLIHRHEIELH